MKNIFYRIYDKPRLSIQLQKYKFFINVIISIQIFGTLSFCLFIEWKKSHLVYNKICNVSLSWYSFQVKMHLCQVSSFVIDADLDGTDYVSTHFVILCFNRFTQSTYAKNGTKYMTCNQVSDYEMLSSKICLWIFFYYILDPNWDSFCL